MLEKVEIAGAPAPVASEVPSMTLGTYLAEAGKALRTNLPRAWVEAIVLDAKATRNGLSIELVEPFEEGGRESGLLRSFVWPRATKEIEAKLGLPLEPATLKGTHVRLLIRTTFHPRWHLSGEVLDVDPAVAQGLIARRLELIRQELRQEKLLGAQQKLLAPEDITAVAVIHPDRSAGWADIRTELERLQECAILQVASYPVPFEGPGSAPGIADALATIGRGQLPDMVLIVRGGGAAAGLAGLANLHLARAVCRCPVPIVTGIGHASDHTLVDELAWRAVDTPSKALGLVKGILRRRCQQACDDHRTIVEVMDRLIDGRLLPLLTASRAALTEAAEKVMATQAARLRVVAHVVEREVITFRGSLDLTQHELDRLAEVLLATVPAVPQHAVSGIRSLYTGIVRTTRGRLPTPDAVTTEARRSVGLVGSFVDRQAATLRVLLAALETNAQRRLGDEASRLTALGTQAQAYDIVATLARGFVLPLDDERRIIRSTEAAQAAASFELLFADGSVTCRPNLP